MLIRMEKAKAKLEQVNINIPPDVAAWLREEESWRDESVSRIAVAGLILFEACTEPAAERALLFASFLIRHRLEWGSIEEYLEASPEAQAAIVEGLRQMACTPSGRFKTGRLYIQKDHPPYVFTLSEGFEAGLRGE